MPERFHAPGPWLGGQVRLSGDEARHLARVRRVPEGALVELLDGAGRACLARVDRIGKDDVQLVLESELKEPREAPLRLSLAVAFPKGERIDWLVEKSVEIGVDHLIPLQTERSVVDPRESKLDRLRKVVAESSKQCGRSRFMTIEPSVGFAQLLKRSPDRPRILCHPGGIPAQSLPRLRAGSDLLLAVGPEGGFTDAEVDSARAAGWDILGLGTTILRIETAALAGALALIHSAEPERG